jgi:hypothetical protein
MSPGGLEVRRVATANRMKMDAMNAGREPLAQDPNLKSCRSLRKRRHSTRRAGCIRQRRASACCRGRRTVHACRTTSGQQAKRRKSEDTRHRKPPKLFDAGLIGEAGREGKAHKRKGPVVSDRP